MMGGDGGGVERFLPAMGVGGGRRIIGVCYLVGGVEKDVSCV